MQILLLFILFSITQAKPIVYNPLTASPIGLVYNELKDVVPIEAKLIYDGMTIESYRIFSKALENHENAPGIIGELKTKNASIYPAVNDAYLKLKAAFDRLKNQEARDFILEAGSQFMKIKPKKYSLPVPIRVIRTALKKVDTNYRALSPDAKKALDIAFPKLSVVAKHRKFQRLWTTIVGF